MQIHYFSNEPSYLSTDSVYIKFVRSNLKVSHRRLFFYVYLQKIFHTYCVSIFMTYLHTKFHTLSSNDSLLIVIKPEAKDNFRTVAMLLFQLPESRGTSIPPISKIRSAIILSLLIARD
jgi:hypothetical protein